MVAAVTDSVGEIVQKRRTPPPAVGPESGHRFGKCVPDRHGELPDAMRICRRTLSTASRIAIPPFGTRPRLRPFRADEGFAGRPLRSVTGGRPSGKVKVN